MLDLSFHASKSRRFVCGRNRGNCNRGNWSRNWCWTRRRWIRRGNGECDVNVRFPLRLPLRLPLRFPLRLPPLFSDPRVVVSLHIVKNPNCPQKCVTFVSAGCRVNPIVAPVWIVVTNFPCHPPDLTAAASENFLQFVELFDIPEKFASLQLGKWNHWRSIAPLQFAQQRVGPLRRRDVAHTALICWS